MTENTENNPEVAELVEQEVKIKRPRGRPRKPPPEPPTEPAEPRKPRGRPRADNPSTAGNPKLGKQYYRNCYQEKLKGVVINCPKCGFEALKLNLTNHLKSNLCLKVANAKRYIDIEIV